MSLSPLQLTTKDVIRARPMLKEQAGLEHTDPWDLLDETGDPDLRRALVIWCVKSRTNPTFTWDQAMETPFGAMYPDDEEPEATPPTPGPTSSGSGPGESSNGGSRRRRPAAEPALNSSTSSG